MVAVCALMYCHHPMHYWYIISVACVPGRDCLCDVIYHYFTSPDWCGTQIQKQYVSSLKSRLHASSQNHNYLQEESDSAGAISIPDLCCRKVA